MKSDAFKFQLASLWRDILRTDPQELFGDESRLLRGETKDDQTAQPGYVGSRYRRGGLLFIGMNPGGRAGTMTQSDHRQLPLLNSLKTASPGKRVARFCTLNRELSIAMPGWRICRPILRILCALDISFSEIAYINVLKWRTTNEQVTTGLLKRSWKNHTAAQVDLLQPCGVISLGRRTGTIVDRFATNLAFNRIIPRSRGDRSEPLKQRYAIEAAIRYLRRQKTAPK